MSKNSFMHKRSWQFLFLLCLLSTRNSNSHTVQRQRLDFDRSGQLLRKYLPYKVMISTDSHQRYLWMTNTVQHSTKKRPIFWARLYLYCEQHIPFNMTPKAFVDCIHLLKYKSTKTAYFALIVDISIVSEKQCDHFYRPCCKCTLQKWQLWQNTVS